MTMRVLVVDSFDPDGPGAHTADAAVEVLAEAGHDVRRISLVTDEFTPFMSTAERLVYHDEGSNILTDEVRRSVEALAWAEGLLFAYPTVCFNPPARLKAWMDRVLLPGVAFGFDDAGRVAPGLTHIRRLGVVTSGPHGRIATARARDGGRRMIMRALRMNCAKTCRRTFVSVGGPGEHKALSRKLSRW